MNKKRRHIKILKHQKRRKKFSKKRYMLYYLFFAILIIVTFLILSLTVFFNITNIEVFGDSKHKEEEILKVCEIKIGDSLILTNCKKSETAIFNSFKDLSSVSVTKTFPNTISIECCDAAALFCCKKEDGNYIIISNNKRIINNSAKNPPDNIITLEILNLDLNKFKEGEFFKLPEKEEQKLKIIQNTIETEQIKNITKIEIDANTTYITFENRITLEIKDISKTDYLIKMSKETMKKIIGRNEKGNLIYIKSKKTLHFIPEKTILKEI